MVTHQLQAKHRTAKVRWPRTDVIPLDHATNRCLCVSVSMRRQYVPLSLLSLQRLVDLGRIDVMKPIDLTALCNTKVVVVDPTKNHYGINLTDEVCIKFCKERELFHRDL